MMPAHRRAVVWSLLVAIVVAGASTIAFLNRRTLQTWLVPREPMAATPAEPPSVPTSKDTTPRGNVSLDLRRRQLIGVRTTTVTRAALPSSIRAVGSVTADETRLTDVNVKIEGWIRDLTVDYAGQPVATGQPLFSFYSPDLVAAEREYVLAVKSRDALRDSVLPEARLRANSLIASARQRLQIYLTSDQLAHLEESLEPDTTITLRSPVDGFVLDKAAVAGMHVMPGQTLYRIANLSRVWIEADVYEHDLGSIHTGETARVTLDAFPAESLTARVIFINPALQTDTRTAKVRFDVPNPQGRLKPGMYANVEITTSSSSALVVPTDAVLDSGREQVVFVTDGNGTFTPRSVQLGARWRDVIEIVSGLKEGEQIATGAAFFLDSESQLRSGVGGAEAGSTSAPTAAGAQPVITLHVQPDPPRAGDNTFDVSVADATGHAMADADVAIEFFMPAMPTMNMPAMRNTVMLLSTGGGSYHGTGEIMMAGRWAVTVTVTQRGRRLGALQTTVVAR